MSEATGAAPARAPRYCGRFAPSPTGPLHFGSLVAAVASCADALAAGGRWLLRIEDVDTPRTRAGAEDAIVQALARHGFRWDGPLVRQSERTAAYAQALARLRAQDVVYACTCSRRALEEAPLAASGERIYPGTCRGNPAAGGGVAAHAAQRVRVGDAVVEFADLLQGPQRQVLARDVGDFVVRRADGLFAYQLAVVVDDAAQDVTTVVRGADLLSSTPRQIFLQRLLGLPTPAYLHVPVAINAAGEKLSKQTRAAALPDDPVPSLLAAWRFLEQPPPAAAPRTPAEFWAHAARAWSRARLPPVAMLPAPRGA
ncbi:MAG: tRNA glutamyl-Q(34) synthetase GluQRS [Burkholderiales bacterium]